MKSLVVSLMIAFFIGSCAPRAITEPQVSERPPEVSQPQEKKEEVGKESETISIKKDEVMERPFEGVAMKKEPEKEVVKKEEFFDIYFDFDKYNIRDDAIPILDNLASFLKKDMRRGILIEGHCDERGTNQYNLALGQRRADAVKQYLMMSGINSERIDTITYGEERPLCREQTEECYSKNRRAHFVLFEVEKR